MIWKEIQIITDEKGIEDVSVLLHDLGIKGVWVEEEGDKVILKSYISELDNEQEFLNRLEGELQRLEKSTPQFVIDAIKVHELNDKSWANEWKNYYEPTRITDRFTVRPVWKEYLSSNEESIIHLDPGMAFGTGTHPTTILAVRLLEKYLEPETEFLDVGCGSGILSIVAIKLGAMRGQAIDIDRVALERTKENLVSNQVENQVQVKQGDLLKGIEQCYDMVVANILADVIIEMAGSLSNVLKPGGVFLCSGIIQEKEEQVRKALSGYQLLDKITMESWVAMAFKRC